MAFSSADNRSSSSLHAASPTHRPLPVARRRLLHLAATLAGGSLSAALVACSPDNALRIIGQAAPAAGNQGPGGLAGAGGAVGSLRGSTPGATPTPRPMPGQLTLTPSATTLPGRMLFVADANIWQLEKGQLRPLTNDRVSRQPSWSPDGKRVAMVKLWTSGSDVVTVSSDGTDAVEVTDFTYRDDAHELFTLYPIFAAEPNRLYFLSQEGTRDTQLWQVTLPGKQRQRFLAQGEGNGGLDHPRLSPDGRTLAVTSYQPGRGPADRPQIWTYTLPNGPWKQLTDAPGGAYDAAWSPDSKLLAYTVRTPVPDRATNRHDIWVMRSDGSGAREVTSSGLNRAPAWSPDGTWLAYLSARTSTFDLWVVSAPKDPAPASPPPVTALPITQNGVLDAVSGVAWAR